MRTFSAIGLVAISLAATGAKDAFADTIVVGAPGISGSGNCYPFGCGDWSPEYQQVYASSDFSAPIKIAALDFYNYNSSPAIPDPGIFTISLSTTLAPVNGLSATYGSNEGADDKIVFNGTLPNLSNSILTIKLSSTFVYNPGSGNLLLNVYSTNPGSTNSFFDYANGNGAFSRDYSPYGGQDGYGLVTGFTTSAVPEASTWAMLLLGFAGLALAEYRQMKRKYDGTFASV